MSWSECCGCVMAFFAACQRHDVLTFDKLLTDIYDIRVLNVFLALRYTLDNRQVFQYID